jgi:vancomycin resistance protein YoaR
LLGIAAMLGLTGTGLLVTYAVQTRGQAGGASAAASEAVVPPGSDPEVVAAVRKAAEAFLERPVTLEFDGREQTRRWRELGVTVDEESLGREVVRLEASGQEPQPQMYLGGELAAGFVPVVVDRKRAVDTLVALKETSDRAPTNARLDMEKRMVHREQLGFGIDVFASMSAVEAAARAGAARVILEGAPLPALITVESLGVSDISSVLAEFSTKFAIADKARNDNLKLAASKLNGYVLAPGQLLSFNQVVGDRTEKEGYKVAHVITAGEMVDGLAGGACQISTTLHGAAFFAGLDVVRSLPHSRPSVYVEMGLDATVAWPNIDLQLRNPYDFPVVIHFKVARGEAKVEILGRKRPYDEIVFERLIEEEQPFDTVTREDGAIPVGNMVVDQYGFPGYVMTRLRHFYRNGKLIKTDKWKLRYKPVTEYVRMGTNPDPNLAPPVQEDPHGPTPPKEKEFRMAR